MWRHMVKPYSGLLGMAAGDAEGTQVRLKEHISPQCVPVSWWEDVGTEKTLLAICRCKYDIYIYIYIYLCVCARMYFN